MTINEIMRDRKSEPTERVLCKDITRGREAIPIQVCYYISGTILFKRRVSFIDWGGRAVASQYYS